MIKLGKISKLIRGAVIAGWIEDLLTRPPGSMYPAH